MAAQPPPLQSQDTTKKTERNNTIMKTTRRKNRIAAALFCALALTNAHAQRSSAEIHSRTIERRAVEAAIWGMPLINFDALRQAFFRDSKANYDDIIYWSRPGAGFSTK